MTHDDLYALHPKETADVLAARLEKYWSIEKKRAKPSLIRAFTYAFGPTFAVAALYKLVYDSLLFAGPNLLDSLIQYMKGDQPTYRGYEYLLLLAGASILSSFTLHQYFHRAFRTGMRLKSAVISLVYKKVSSSSSSSSSSSRKA